MSLLPNWLTGYEPLLRRLNQLALNNGFHSNKPPRQREFMKPLAVFIIPVNSVTYMKYSLILLTLLTSLLTRAQITPYVPAPLGVTGLTAK